MSAWWSAWQEGFAGFAWPWAWALLPLPLLRLNALRWNLIGPRRHDGGDGLRSTSGLLQASELIHGDRVAAELRGLSRRWNPTGRRRDPKSGLRRDVAGRLRMARDPPHP